VAIILLKPIFVEVKEKLKKEILNFNILKNTKTS